MGVKSDCESKYCIADTLMSAKKSKKKIINNLIFKKNYLRVVNNKKCCIFTRYKASNPLIC